jgi:hypothetical protein
MGGVDSLRPELLRQALAQSPQTKLARCERTSRLVTSQSGGGASEDQSSLLPKLVNLLLLERKDSFAGETKGSSDIRVEALADLFLLHFEERLPEPRAGVEDGTANGGAGPFGANLAESLGEGGEVVGGNN